MLITNVSEKDITLSLIVSYDLGISRSKERQGNESLTVPISGEGRGLTPLHPT